MVIWLLIFATGAIASDPLLEPQFIADVAFFRDLFEKALTTTEVPPRSAEDVAALVTKLTVLGSRMDASETEAELRTFPSWQVWTIVTDAHDHIVGQYARRLLSEKKELDDKFRDILLESEQAQIDLRVTMNEQEKIRKEMDVFETTIFAIAGSLAVEKDLFDQEQQGTPAQLQMVTDLLENVFKNISPDDVRDSLLSLAKSNPHLPAFAVSTALDKFVDVHGPRLDEMDVKTQNALRSLEEKLHRIQKKSSDLKEQRSRVRNACVALRSYPNPFEDLQADV